MHQSVRQWVTTKVAELGLAGRATLEVGSLYVNGGVRDLFSDRYIGCDIQPGPGVDVVVAPGGQLPGDGWPVIVSTEMLEHDEQPWVTLTRMHEVAAPGAVLLLTCRGIGFPLHEHPGDHWRFSTTGLRHLLEACGWEPVEVTPDPDPQSPGVFAFARCREV